MSILRTISVADLKDELLNGIKTSTAMGSVPKYSDQFYLRWLRKAAEMVARELDLVLTGEHEAVYEEKLDGIEWDRHAWSLKVLKHRPIISVEEMEYALGANPSRSVPVAWVNIASKNQGQVVIIPSAQTMAIIEQFSVWWHYQHARYIPLTFRIKVKAGFAWEFPGTIATTQGSTTGTAVLNADETRSVASILNGRPWLDFGTEVLQVASVSGSTVTFESAAGATTTATPVVLAYPEDMRYAVMLLAAIPILEIMGTNLYGNPGMNSKSLAMDALSQGKGIAVGKGFGPYSALITQYYQQYESVMASLYGEFAPVNMTFV